jgi:HK97 family phage major capsid protein
MDTAIKQRMDELDRILARVEENPNLYDMNDREVSDAYYAALNEKRALESAANVSSRRALPDSGSPHGTNRLAVPPTRWHNLATGEEVRVFAPHERMAPANSEVSLGRYVRGLVTGNWKGADREKILALGEGGAGGGHVLVPDELSTMWLDLARAQSVLIKGGMATVDMRSETMTIARLDSDPTFHIVAENDAITESDITFGSVQLVSRKIATLITASREIFEDAPNAAQIVESVMGRSLAVALDGKMLVGNGGSDGVKGITSTSGVGSTASVGAIAWEDFHNAVIGVRESNYNPNAIVVHPTILGDAQILTSGDGTNSAKLWLGPPPSLAGVDFLQTTAVTTALAVAGEFKHCLMGVRTGMALETTTSADDAFEKHQVKFKITQRFAFAVTQPSAFYVLSGITT